MTTYTHEPPEQAPPSDAYPATLDIDYAEGNRNRLTVLLRLFTMIPIVILISSFNSSSYSSYDPSGDYSTAATGLSILFLPVLLMIVFRQKYPKWWFDFNLELTRFSTRVGAYIALVTDAYPSTDEEQSVHLSVDYPDAQQLNRWLPLFKWLLAIPHYIALLILAIVGFVLVVLSWFIILLTGKMPLAIHQYLVGVSRYSLRVNAYAFLLTTDRYPPFSLD